MTQLRRLLSPLNRKVAELSTHEGVSLRWQVVVFVVAMLAIFSRSPSMFLHAQFFAEDGPIWFAQAYNGGWLHSLIMPNVGYYSTLERLGAGLALVVPLQFAPLTMSVFGAVIQWLPTAILISPRCRSWMPLSTRLFMAALYIALPNAGEIHVVLTNTMWHLALAALLLAFADEPRTWLGRVFDCLVLLLSSLSGPYGILLLPFFAIFWWLKSRPWTLVGIATTGLGAAIQVLCLLHTGGSRAGAPLGATVHLFVQLVGGSVFADTIFGSFALGYHAPFILSVVCFLIGSAIILYSLRFAPLPLKLLIAYCFVLLFVELKSPLVIGHLPLWQTLLRVHSIRYWFFAALAFAWSACWCAFYAQSRPMRRTAALVLLAMCVGIVADWTYEPFQDAHFDRSVQRFQQAKPGEMVRIPIVPKGWMLDLIKKN